MSDDEGTLKCDLWSIRYDKLDAFAYDGEELNGDVAFAGEHMLYEVNLDTLLPWRFEGQDWQPENETDPAEAEDATSADTVPGDSGAVCFTLDGGLELCDAVDQVLQTVLGRALQALGETMQKCPLDAQHRAAEGISRAREIMAGALLRRMQDRHEPSNRTYECTAEDVAFILEEVKPQMTEILTRVRSGHSPLNVA